MDTSDDEVAAALETPLGQAFQRLLAEEGFVDRVIAAGDEVAAEYELDDEQLEALVSDAYALEGEVAGFGRMRRMNPEALFNLTAGLRVPPMLGLPRGIVVGGSPSLSLM